MKIVVIDGQGGNIGRRIVEEIKAKKTGCEILAIGTNSTATALMMITKCHLPLPISLELGF